ncbi:MAG: copper homeostasis protein CutC [Lacipirellulaceae bacterium]
MPLDQSDHTRRSPLLEVCVESLDDALDAVAAGADRLELCAAIELGGLTPSEGLLREVVASVGVPVAAMVRPRSGGFRCTAGELRVMLADVSRALAAGAAAVVFGALKDDGQIDLEAVRRVVARAEGAPTVFHRAIDATPDPVQSARLLADCGVTRVLTSGGRATALEGAETLRRMIEATRGTLTVTVGGGVRAENVLGLVELTGCSEVHIGPSRIVSGGATGALDFRDRRPFAADEHRAIDAAAVGAVVHALRAIDRID